MRTAKKAVDEVTRASVARAMAKPRVSKPARKAEIFLAHVPIGLLPLSRYAR